MNLFSIVALGQQLMSLLVKIFDLYLKSDSYFGHRIVNDLVDFWNLFPFDGIPSGVLGGLHFCTFWTHWF
jgi:hypothetical protein